MLQQAFGLWVQVANRSKGRNSPEALRTAFQHIYQSWATVRCATPTFHLSRAFGSREGGTLSVGANNLFEIRPDRVNAEGLRVAALAGSPAVEIYPNFSAFGVNGGYYYARVTLAF